MSVKKKFVLYKEKDWINVIEYLMPHIKKGIVIALNGNLGAGKTTCAKFIIRKLLQNHCLDVTSPTFNILNLYQKQNMQVIHADLYRINHIDELHNIGFFDYEKNNTILLVEWIDIVKDYLNHKNIVDISINMNKINDDSKILNDHSINRQDKLIRNVTITHR